MSPFNINFNNKKAHVNAADRPAFIEEFHKKYVEEEKAKEAANPTSDNHKKLLDSLEDATSKSRLRKREREATRTRAYNTLLNSLKTREDFDELSAMGQRKAASGLFDRTNMTGKTAEEQGVVKETRDDVFHQNIYDYMTPEQKSMYYAFLGLGDQQSAKRYLASIEEGLQKQAVEKLTETIQPSNIENVQDFADVTRLGVRSGIGRFETGVQQLVNPNAVSKNYTEMAFEEARKNMSGATGMVADLSNTVGFMLLPVGGSFALGLAGGAGLAASKAASNGVKALSAALFGAASGGSTYNDVLREDPTGDKFDQKVYSIINGALEGSLQYLLGGIGKLGAGGLFKATGKSISGAVAKKLSNVAKASANTPAVKGLIKALVGGGKWAAGASDEALEEWLQAVLDPVMRNQVLGENNEVRLFGEDQLYAAFLGALGASVMNAPSNIGSAVNAEQVLEETVAKQEAKAAERANKRKGAQVQPANLEAKALPEATKEQIEAHMDNPDVKDLVIQINRLEAGIATGRSRHNDSPTGRKAQLAKAKKDLAALIAKLEQQQAPEQVPVDNAAGIPGPPPAPVADNGIRNGVEGEITSPIENVRPTGQRINDTRINRMSPGDMRRQNVRDRVVQQTEGLPFNEGLGDRVGGGQASSSSDMVQWFRDNIASSFEQLREGSQMLEPVHSWVYDDIQQFRNYAQNILGWSEEQIEAEIASWNVPEYFTTPPEAIGGHARATDLARQARERVKAQSQQRQEAAVETEEITEKEQHLARLEEQQKQLLEQVKQQEEQIKQQNEQIAQLTGEAVPETEAAANEEFPAAEEEYEGYTLEETVDRYRSDIAEAKRNRDVMRGEGYDYDQYIKMLEINFRHDAAELGMSKAEIEAIINSEGSTTRTANHEEKAAPNPTETASEAVTDEDIDELLNEESAPVENPVESKQATGGMDNIRDIADAVVNEEMDVNEGYDEIRDLLNQMDQEREAAGEAVGVATEPEVTVTEGRIEVRFPKWPGRKTTDELRKAGFKWDKEAGIWFGGENNTNRALVERLTSVKLTENEFKPEVKRIPKDNHGNPDTRFSINNDTAIVEDENVDRMVDAVMQRLQDEGVVDNFNRSDMPEGVEGSQRGKNITVSEKVSGTTRAANAATHEIGHLAARSDPKLVPDVISSMRQMGVDVDGRIEERRATYGEEGLTPPEGVSEQEYIEEEVAMDFLGGISENDVETLNKIAAKEPGLIQRFINGLKKIWGKLTGDQKLLCEACINRLNTALAKANTGSNIDEDESTRYSVGTKPSSTANAPTVPSSTFTPNENGEAPVDRMIPGVEEIWQDLPDSAKNYMIKHLTDINGEAWKNIMKKGGVDAVSGTLLRAKNWTSPQLEMAVEVGKYFADNGETDRAADIFAKVASQQTDFGRAIKYLQTLQMYMPKSAAAITHSIANDLGVELTKEEQANIDLCDRIIEQGFISDSVLNKATGDFKEWLNDAREYMDRGQLDASTAAYAAAMTLVTAKKPTTARQKFRSLQRISLLSNPKTHFRNILGNMAEQAGSAMSRPVADLTDRFLSKFTKGQRTFGAGGGEAFAKAVADSIERAVMDHALGINTVGNKFDEDTSGRKGLERLVQQGAWDEHTKNEVRNGIAKIANNIDGLIGLGLSIGDAPFLIGTYESALAQIMSANKATEATAEMMDTAWDVAYRRTFRDDNSVTKALSSIRNSLPFVGETIAPYVQTPVNVVLTALQYSPIGLGEAITKAFFDIGGVESLRTKLKNGESTMKVQRQIAELVGRGALGTAAMLVGALLASAGRITGDDDDIDSQKEKNWNTATGRKGSSIKIGDTYIDPSSLQSLSTPIMAGAAAYQSGEEEDETGQLIDILAAAAKASMKMGNTMLEMPVLQGVADLFSGNYDNGELLAGALSLAGNAATQVVPFGSLLKQAGKAVDPYSRVQSEINAGPVERVAKSTVNNLRSMTPWGREKLSERYDVLGNPIKNDASDNVVERLYNSFINPFNTSKENTNEVTDEIDRLYAALQDTDVLPSAAGNSISYGGEKYKFTSAEKQEYQRIEGESNAEILSSLVNSEAYSNLSDEDKAKILSSVYDYSANKAKADYLKKQGVEYESDAKWMDSIDSIVEAGVDIGSAMVYRYEINQIDGADDQAYYIMDLPISADQKKALDTQFVDKFGFRPIKDDRDYTSKDALVLSMTSDKGRDKYNRIFSGQWTGSSGNTYPALTGEQFGDFYDAFYFKESPKAAESTESIKQMLMQKYGMDEDSAYIMAYDFRKIFASTKL